MCAKIRRLPLENNILKYFYQKIVQRGENNPNWKGSSKKTRSEIAKKYRCSHKEQGRIRLNKYRKNNRKKVYDWEMKNKKYSLAQWRTIIPPMAKCEICGIDLVFNSGVGNKSIHFDHRTGDEPISKCPSTWLNCHALNDKNLKIWKECNFGILCRTCNKSLPTKNRKDFVLKLNKYVFGSEVTIGV